MKKKTSKYMNDLFHTWVESIKYTAEGETTPPNCCRTLENMELLAERSLQDAIEKGGGFTQEVDTAFVDLIYYGQKAGFYAGFEAAKNLLM